MPQTAPDSPLLHRRIGYARGQIEEALGDGRVVLVDDAGWEAKAVQRAPNYVEFVPTVALKPTNALATELYHSICEAGTMHQIVGDVAVCWDRDFAR